MKILTVSASDIHGGAAKAAYRLHRALFALDINSLMLVQNKLGDDFTVLTEERKTIKLLNTFRPIISSIPLRAYPNRSKALFSPAWLGFNNIAETINAINPDIVHLHWICEGMMKIDELARIKAPIVWSLHDMWAFTGGCHYNSDCDAYLQSCGNCTILGSTKANDISKQQFNRKQKIYSLKKEITVIGLSRWLMNCSKNSPLLGSFKHLNLPNPIDTDIYKPFEKQRARELWNLPLNKKLVLFGAMSTTNDPRKGFHKLLEALHYLTTQHIEFVIFGSSQPKTSLDFGITTHYIGNLNDDISLTTLYNAVDVMVVPSLQENLSNAVMESLSCGIPVVAFNIGGNNDLIDHKQNGYLANPYDAIDLANGIKWVLESQNYNELCRCAREKVIMNFDSQVVAQKYIKLYKEILHA